MVKCDVDAYQLQNFSNYHKIVPVNSIKYIDKTFSQSKVEFLGGLPRFGLLIFFWKSENWQPLPRGAKSGLSCHTVIPDDKKYLAIS